MNPVLPLPQTDRFALIVDQVCRAIASRAGFRLVPETVILLIFARLRRMAARFARLVARYEAGKAYTPRAVVARARVKEPPPRTTWVEVRADELPHGVQRHRGWITTLAPEAAVRNRDEAGWALDRCERSPPLPDAPPPWRDPGGGGSG